MKIFEGWFPEQDERIFDLTEDKECCAATWRQAFKAIQKEINSEDAPSVSELAMFIDEELNE